MTDYKAQQQPVYDYGVFSIDAILPPKDEEIHVNRYGTVIMNVKSLEQILTELPKERNGNTSRT